MIVLDLPPAILTRVDTMAARAGMTSSSWLAEQIAHAFGAGMIREATDPPRQSRSSRRRHAARARAEREVARLARSTSSNTD